MKKIIAVFLSCTMLFGVLVLPCFAQEPLAENCCYIGDFNEDAIITAVDARMFLQSAAGVRTYDAARFPALDCNEDGKLNAVDARHVLQMASGRRNKVVLHLDTGEREVIGPPIYALEEAVSLVCAQTASAAAGGYTVSGNCALSEDVDVGSTTSVLNKVIQSVDPNADVNSVFGAFLGVGQETYKVQAADARPVGRFDLQAFRLTAADIQQYYQEGYTLYFRLQDCQNPQKNGTQSLAKVTNAFPTEAEIADAFQQQVGSTGMRVNAYQSTVSDILLTVVLSDSGIESLKLHYVNDMDLELKMTSLSMQSTGQTTTDILYSDFTQA